MRKKSLAAFICVLILAAGGLAVWAYFTDQDEANNTFTVGKIGITLDEEAVNADGTPTEADDERVQENEYHLIPGHSYIKDPTVHINENSNDCWIYVSIDNQITAIEQNKKGNDTVAEQMAANGWTLVDGSVNVYAYKEIVSAGDDVIVFENFTIDGDSVSDEILKGNGEGMDSYEGKQIVVKAFAIQAAGFDTAQTAWDNAKSQFKLDDK